MVDIDPTSNRVTVGSADALAKSTLVAHQVNSLSGKLTPGGLPVRCEAKIRYNHQPQPATAHLSGDNELTVKFDDPQNAITPGQAVVLFDGDVVLGGAWIDSAH